MGTLKSERAKVMAAAGIDLSSKQRETLRQAMTDAVYFRDPPVQCANCPADGLCTPCSQTLARARSYRELSKAIGLEPGSGSLPG
jgi:uncharacterized membrane protein